MIEINNYYIFNRVSWIVTKCHVIFQNTASALCFSFSMRTNLPSITALPLCLPLSLSLFWQTLMSGTGVPQTSKLAQREWGKGHTGTTRVTSKLQGFPRAMTLSLRLCRSETRDIRRKTPAGAGWQTSRCAQTRTPTVQSTLARSLPRGARVQDDSISTFTWHSEKKKKLLFY